MLRQWTSALSGLFMVCGGAHAASCGTFAAPLACSLTVGGQVTYTATNFNVQSSSGSKLYQPGDIAIDISALGGNAIVMGFSKDSGGPTAGGVFFVNAGDNAGLVLRYELAIAPVLPGTVDFVSQPTDVRLATSSALANGFSSVQLILSDGNQGVSCLALRNSNSVTSGDCALPPNTGTTLQAGDFVTLFGGTGNTSIGTFENRFGAAFTAAVPEPATWALFGVGALVLARRTRQLLR